MAQQYESGFSTIIAVTLNPADTSITLAVAPEALSGRMYITDGSQREWISYTGVSGTTLTGVTRKLDSFDDPATGGTGLQFNAGTPIVLVAMHDQLPNKKVANTFVGDQTVDGALTVDGLLSFTGTDTPGVRLKSLTTAQRDALTPANGDKIYNSTTGTEQTYYGGQWNDAGTSTVANATDAITGKVRLADQTQVDNGTDTEAGDPLVVIPSTLKVVTDALASSLATQVAINNRRFGTGSDGAQTGALTITGSNNTYILKQYTSFTPGANTVTITPTNCILHIKVQGNVDLTGTTFSFAGKGGAGGDGAFNAPGNNGSDAIASMGRIRGGYGTGTALVDYGLAGYFGNDLNPFTKASCGSGGGAGGGDGFAAGGDGGAGGGCVIIECGGNLTFSSTTENFNGLNGSNGRGGGGGGGGGSIIHLYRGTLIGTPTVNVAGGTGGTPATSAEGGNGGSSLIGLGATQVSGTGGNGAAGVSVLQQI